MKKFYFLLIFLTFLLQFSFLPVFLEDFEVPNLVLIGAALIGFRKSFLENLGWFVLAGFVFETFSADLFGFYWLLFILIGFIAWVLRNLILNEEFDFLIEISFWLLIKISWDLFFQLESFVLKTFGKDEFNPNFSVFISWPYFKNLIFFVLIGLIMSWSWNFLIRKRFNKR